MPPYTVPMSDSSNQPVLAIVGATGAVGVECLSIISDRDFQCRELRLFASSRSAGKSVKFRDQSIELEELRDGCFEGIDIAMFSAGGGISKVWGPKAVSEGSFVIDNSSAFRMDANVPLVIPEINGEELSKLTSPSIIANPNCSTIIALMAVTPLHRAVGIKRMVISTYQSASGAGAAAMRELEQQVHDHATGDDYKTDIFGKQYLFNLFSHNTAIGEDGYNEEERKMIRETHKIWADDSVQITATCVRVPVLRAHSEAINLTFKGSLSEDEAREILSNAPGVKIVDDREVNNFPEPVKASGCDDVLVGRIRADVSQPVGKGLEMFVSGDQLRKGAALNAVQIAERLVPTLAGVK